MIKHGRGLGEEIKSNNEDVQKSNRCHEGRRSDDTSLFACEVAHKYKERKKDNEQSVHRGGF